MSKIIENQYGDLYKTPGFWTTTGAITAGSLAGGLVQSGPSILSAPKLIKGMQKKSQSIDNKELKRAVYDAFEKSGLTKNGVEIIEAKTPEKKQSLFDVMIGRNVEFKSSEEFKADKLRMALYNEVLPSKMIKNFKNSAFEEGLKWVAKIKAELYARLFENGYNAAYLPKGNKIVVNIEQLGASAFHEMGHAMNKNQSIFWRSMQKLRAPMMIAGATLPTIALLKRKKVEGEEPTNTFDKATTFIKDNVGKLTTLAFAPIVAEELMATRRGNKLAKQVLNPDAVKKVKATNRFGAASYICAAILAGLGAKIGSDVKDKIAKPKLVG